MSDLIVITPVAQTVALRETNPVHLSIGLAKGDKGEPGHSFAYPAGEALGGHRMTVLLGGRLYYADKDNPAHEGAVIGMTTGAALEGADATVITDGMITEPTWALDPDTALYLGNNGMATTAAPGTGFVLEIGLATSATGIFIRIGKAYSKG